MGAGYHGGFGSTKGAKSHQKAVEEKQKNSLIDPKIVSEMERNNIKFTRTNLVFTTKDKTGQIIFLEIGKDDAGLKHIQQRHTREFFEAFSVKKEDIPHFLYKVVREGNIVDNHIEIRNGRQTITKVYDYQGNYYILTGVGTNGFIVTARPAKKE
ncbi:MAG: hypothetical protein IJX98_04765 [Clostridia bacterium]|nr:hypothetical protein [Clostridia bacterium]